MKFWITGAEGLVGTHLGRLLSSLNIPYVGTSKHEADITNPTKLLEAGKVILPTHIVNCAAYTHVDLAESEPEKAYAINRDGAESLAKIAKTLNARFIHLSSNYVFGGTLPLYDEKAPCSPLGVYGKSKREAEERILLCYPEACIIRTSWVFGPGGNNFLSNLWSWLTKNETIRIVTDQRASLTYVKDLCEATVLLRNQKGIFHFSNTEPTTRYEIAEELLNLAKARGIEVSCHTLQKASSAEFQAKAPRPLLSAFNLQKYTETISAPRSWKEALKEYFLYDLSP